MLQKLTLIWITTKCLSHAKSLELFTAQFCSMETSKLSPSLFNFPPYLPPAACTISYHKKRSELIFGRLWCSVEHHFIPEMRGFCCCLVQLLIGSIILCFSAENVWKDCSKNCSAKKIRYQDTVPSITWDHMEKLMCMPHAFVKVLDFFWSIWGAALKRKCFFFVLGNES